MTKTGATKRIAILLPNLHPGGAEHLHLNLAKEWISCDMRVDFVLRRAEGHLLDLLPDCSKVVDLHSKRVRNVLFPLMRYLRQSPPDVLLAAMWPLTVIAPLAARLSGFRGRVVVSEHSPLSRAYAGRGRLHRQVMRISQALAYPMADARIAVSGGVADDLAALSGLARNRFEVIHNPAALGQLPKKPPPCPITLNTVQGPLILSVGTLKKVKRHDVLLEAFARLPETLSARLCILGEGAERTNLENQAATLGISDRLMLPGFVAETAPWYTHADLFVLSSDYEGFGNVIVEAMEHGLPVVSTDCPAGPREILADGRFGRLVPVGDAEALAQAMAASLGGTHDSLAMKARATDFAVDKVAAIYLDALLPGWQG